MKRRQTLIPIPINLKKVFDFNIDFSKLKPRLLYINGQSIFSSNDTVNHFDNDLNYFYDTLNGFIN